MLKLRLLLLFSFLTIILATSMIPITASENDSTVDLEVNSDGAHEVRVEASQWEFVAFDMVQVQRLIDAGQSEADAMDASKYKHRIGSFIKGAHVILSVVSRDVQHGFSINELGILVATNRPIPPDEFGAPTVVEFDAPDKDVTYSGFCHIFCGLGHPDMKLKFVIGLGSKDFGQEIFWSVIAINVGIFGFTMRSLFSKLGKTEEEIVAA